MNTTHLDRAVAALVALVILGASTSTELGAQATPSPFAALPLAEAKARAQTDKLFLLIAFATPALEPCRRLMEQTWPDSQLREWLGSRAVAVQVDPETERALARQHRIDAYPTTVLLHRDGRELGRVIGFAAPADMLQRLSDAAATESTDFKEREQLGDAAAAQGNPEKALEHYLWCWDHGEKHDPSMAGVRVSFFLSRLAKFAATYPPARAALEARSAAAAERIIAGKIDLGVVTDMVRINEQFDDRAKSLAVLEKVPAAKWRRHAAERTLLFESVLELLLDGKRYKDILALGGDPTHGLARATELLNLPGVPADFVAHQRRAIVERYVGVVEALYAVGDKAAATALGDNLLGIKADGETWVALIEAASRAGNAMARHDLATRALRELPEAEQGPIRQALRAK